MAPRGRSGPLGGRPSATTRGHLSGIAIDLFIENGFDETSVDDIAAAAGIARRTLFRYYPSKNSLAWGEFDDHLDGLRGLLDEADGTGTLGTELRDAIVAFNQVPDSRTARDMLAHFYEPWRSRAAACRRRTLLRRGRCDRSAARFRLSRPPRAVG